jgi:hypothetical protein
VICSQQPPARSHSGFRAVNFAPRRFIERKPWGSTKPHRSWLYEPSGFFLNPASLLLGGASPRWRRSTALPPSATARSTWKVLKYVRGLSRGRRIPRFVNLIHNPNGRCGSTQKGATARNRSHRKPHHNFFGPNLEERDHRADRKYLRGMSATSAGETKPEPLSDLMWRFCTHGKHY